MARILVIDDDPDMLTMVELSLRPAGHEVTTLADPLLAEEKLREVGPQVVILDVMMPGISGWDLLETLHAQKESRGISVLMLSTLSDVNHRIRGLRSGADDYLPKPFDPDELLARVEALLARRSAAGLRGSLNRHSFTEVVQSLEQNRKTGTLHVHAQQIEGSLVIDEGVVLGASLNELSGRDAVMTMLELSDGEFAFVASKSSTTSDESGESPISIQSVLLEAAWLQDELEKRSLDSVDPSAPLLLSSEAPLPPPGLEELPFGEVIALIREREAVTLDEAPRQLAMAPVLVHLIVACLAEQGVLATEARELAIPVPTPPGETYSVLLVSHGQDRRFVAGLTETMQRQEPGRWTRTDSSAILNLIQIGSEDLAALQSPENLASVVIWLGLRALPAWQLLADVNRVTRLAPGTPVLVLAGSTEAYAAGRGALGRRDGWTVHDGENPSSLDELLTLLGMAGS